MNEQETKRKKKQHIERESATQDRQIDECLDAPRLDLTDSKCTHGHSNVAAKTDQALSEAKK